MAKHSSTFTGSETAANLNSANAKTVTVKAKWKSNCNDGLSSVGSYKNFDYTGSVQTFNACAGRTYKLEVWGAEGGHAQTNGSVTTNGPGKGGYSYGTLSISSNVVLYVYVGGQGSSAKNGVTSNPAGGWNGGGNGNGDNDSDNDDGSGAGGGGTDIALHGSSGSTSWNTTNHLYSRIIVAGGGGGNSGWGVGASGGGLMGGTGHTDSNGGGLSTQAVGGTQTAGYAFGYGANGAYVPTAGTGGGGGGWYGGKSGTSGSYHHGGGGGSGYIYNSASEPSYPSGKLVNSSYYLSNARMYMYDSYSDCTSSTATATYTVCTSSTGAHVANAANTGNGYAKITRQS